MNLFSLCAYFNSSITNSEGKYLDYFAAIVAAAVENMKIGFASSTEERLDNVCFHFGRD